MKKNTLFTLFLLTSILSYGQLTVSNNTYIYVDGTGFDDSVADTAPLFVTNDINLQDTNSNIYLRNDAQVLQGNDVKNSGIGRLSVYQEGNVNEYAYNYWSSPTGNVSANTSLNRDFIPNQNIYDVVDLTNSNLAGYSTSNLNGTSSPLNIESYWIWKFFPGLTYSDWIFVGYTGNVEPGYGFTMKGTIGSTAAAGQQYDFRGKPNTGHITTSVIDGSETLVGNPYPSALDAAAYIHDPQNIAAMTGDLYYWEQAVGANSHNLEDYVGGYATYTTTPAGVDSFTPAVFSFFTVNGTPVALPFPQSGTKIARRYIAVGQGFFIQGSPGTTGIVYTKNSHRAFYKESSVSSNFFRVNNTQSNDDVTYNEYGLNIVPDDFKRFRINVDLEQTYTRQLLLNFHDTATDGFDYGLEGKISGTLASDAYCIDNNTPYNIQAFSFDTNLAIPIVVKTEFDQLVTFRIFDIQNFEDAQPIFVHDILNDTYMDLRIQEFNVNLSTGTFENRFEIVFQNPNSLSNDEFLDADFLIFQDNEAQELVIKNPNNIPLKAITLYDITGKKVINFNAIKNNTRTSVSTKNLSDGAYVAKIETENNSHLNKKIIVKN